MTLYVDNTGAIDLAEDWSTTGRTKHINVRFHYLREMNEQGMIRIKFVKSEWNVSDIFMKNLSEGLFHHHVETLGIIPRDKEGVNIRGEVMSRADKNLLNVGSSSRGTATRLNKQGSAPGNDSGNRSEYGSDQTQEAKERRSMRP